MLSVLALAAAAPGNDAWNPTIPPDVSFDVTPVAYYGAQFSRDAANIDMLSKMQIVTLMQEDGPCWMTCCPEARNLPGGKCDPTKNASLNAGCDPSCDQQGTQNLVFARVKAAARAAGRRPPHCMLFHNSVYDWPFDRAHERYLDNDVLDVHGNVHMESCDPGIFPSYFFDYSRPAGRQAYLDVISRLVVNGSADGVYADCYSEYGLRCNKTDPTSCRASRNGKAQDLNTEVTPAHAQAYMAAKDKTLAEAADLVGANGSFLAKYQKPGRPAPHGGNLIYTDKGVLDPGELIQDVSAGLKNYEYIIVGGSNDYVHPSDNSTAGTCDETKVAAFLIAAEPGCFLLCNGYGAFQANKLGLPSGPAKVTTNGTTSKPTFTRTFASGTVATWSGGVGSVKWDGIPTPPPSPPSPPLPPSPPSPPPPGRHSVNVTRMMSGFAMKTHGQGTSTSHAAAFTSTQCQAECGFDPHCRSWNWHMTYHGTTVCEHIPAVHCPIPPKTPVDAKRTACGATTPTVVPNCS